MVSVVDGTVSESAPLHFGRELSQIAGTNPSVCFQCQKCSAGCPAAADTDVKPHELLRLVHLGLRDEVLGSRFIWECTSCGTCEARCPQGVALPRLIDALRRLSRNEKKVVAGTSVPVFNDVFLGIVRRAGRAYELGLMAAFKLRTRRFRQDIAKAPTMLRKGKLSLLPTFVGGRAARKRLFKRAEKAGRER